MRRLSLLLLVLALALTARAQFFTDAPSGRDGRLVDDVAYHQLMEGYPDGYFHPEKPLTRQESIMVLTRLCNISLRGFMLLPGTAQPDPIFPDLSANHWMRNALDFLAEKGMLGLPYSQPLRPLASVTRGEFLTYLHRVMHQGETASAETAATALVEASLLPEEWLPALQQPITRIETARLLENSLYYLTQNAETEGVITSLESDEDGNRWAKLETVIGACRLYLPERGVLVEGGRPADLRAGARIRTLSDAVASSKGPSYYRVRAVTVEAKGPAPAQLIGAGR